MRKRDEDDYREYVAGRLERWRRSAYFLCHDWHLADDLVSITAGKLYRHWPRVREVERLDAYVGRMLVNAWQDEVRRTFRRDVFQSVDERTPAPPEPDVLERLSLLELLRRLPARQRAAVVLRFYDDLSIEETAVALGCTEGTVKSLSSRGLQSLRALAGRTNEETS